MLLLFDNEFKKGVNLLLLFSLLLLLAKNVKVNNDFDFSLLLLELLKILKEVFDWFLSAFSDFSVLLFENEKGLGLFSNNFLEKIFSFSFSFFASIENKVVGFSSLVFFLGDVFSSVSDIGIKLIIDFSSSVLFLFCVDSFLEISMFLLFSDIFWGKFFLILSLSLNVFSTMFIFKSSGLFFLVRITLLLSSFCELVFSSSFFIPEILLYSYDNLNYINFNVTSSSSSSRSDLFLPKRLFCIFIF